MNIIQLLQEITADRELTTALRVNENEWILDEDPYIAMLLNELIEEEVVNETQNL